jgi:hypothetical protein
MRAIREGATGSGSYADVAVCAAIGAGYALIGMLVVGRLLQAARERATLALT